MPENTPFSPSGLPKGSDQFVEAFARGLSVIRAFGPRHQSLTLSEVAQRSGLTAAGARRLLHTLITLGYARIEQRKFCLTPAILELGYAYLTSLPLSELARAAVDDYMEKTGEICTVSVLDRHDIVYIARAEMPSPLSRRLGVGERLPAHATSSGQILLSGLDADALGAYLSHAPFERLTQNTIIEARPLKNAILQAGQKGFAIASQQLELGICGLAVPIRDDRNKIVAALTTSLNLARHQENTILPTFLPIMQKTADSISRRLGNRPA